ncbi:hypothetical protein FRC09_016608 [Ceratobasidium sp. 395]|nr:hypothetical protein FRC09_016608 [Ceratobasidium sp. 395]
MPNTYKVIMRGETFLLTRDQIEFDSPNYFTSCFFGEFSEAKTRTLTISRDPELFKIILDYLSGYDVLPLHESVVPERMSSYVVLRNLLADAQFYQLGGLIDQVNQENQVAEEAEQPLTSSYAMISVSCTKETPRKITWSPAVPLSEEAVDRMRQAYGIQPILMNGFEGISPAISETLEEAELPTSYLVEAAWAEHTSILACFSFVLKLV